MGLFLKTAAPHWMGAALTYARRYALFTLVRIAGEGGASMRRTRVPRPMVPPSRPAPISRRCQLSRLALNDRVATVGIWGCDSAMWLTPRRGSRGRDDVVPFPYLRWRGEAEP
jgi:hypothetical protein